jgi:hypothetical protein
MSVAVAMLFNQAFFDTACLLQSLLSESTESWLGCRVLGQQLLLS